MMELNDQNFKKEVLENSKMVLVIFWSPGCGPCFKMEPIIEELAKEFENRVGVGKLNIIENPEIAKTMSMNALENIKHYSWQRYMDELISSYNKIFTV